VRRPLPAPGRRHAGAGLLLAALLLLVALPAAGQQSPQREITESQRRLEQIRREQRELRTEMGRIRTSVQGISSELTNLEGQVRASSRLLQEMDFQIAQRERQIAESAQELEATRERLAARRSALHQRVRGLYKRGPLHTMEVLLTAHSFSDLLNRYRYLFYVARYDQHLVEEIGQLEAQLEARERALRSNLAQLQASQAEKAQEHANLTGLQQQQRRALQLVRTQEQRTASRIEELVRDEQRLTNLIATLERRRREAERLAAERRAAAAAAAAASGAAPPPARAAAPAGLSTRDLGNLGWPVEGRVLYNFGRTTQPNGTVVRWNGIGIGAEPGAPVRAVEAGTVVMAGPFEGYGPTVVLSHGEGYYSLYLYLRELRVREGDEVARSQPIGTVGGERTPEGAHIEFQIRAPGGEAVDPLTWLRRRPS
jgi:murein hydrolase activator